MPPQKATTRKARPQSIYIVDDHPIFREGLIHLLTRERDLKVCGEADDAGEALAQIPQLKPDLVLMDVSLPSKSGLELIKDLRAVCRDLAVLVISMHDESLYAERVLRAGARGYIMKQEGPARMLQAIRQVLEGHVFLSESMAARLLETCVGGRAAQIRLPIDRLSDREFEILQLIGRGRSGPEIARHLHLSPKTVDAHRAHIKAKLKLKSGPELVHFAIRWVEANVSSKS
ncbi:MAG: response regulator transcription factor [Verrucomicrobia bacterium]|nr:response regulator transcription factor [Verrucomicrobiota bacterium]